MPKRREGGGMDNRVLIKARAIENCVCFRTINKRKKSPHEFYILRDNLLKLRTQDYVVACDINSFAEICREAEDRVMIRFFWLNCHSCDNSVAGWLQIVCLPFKPLMEFAEHGGRGDSREEWAVLSLKDSFSPKYVFVDTQNLKKAVENLAVRRKLARFLSRNFHYRNATEIRFFNDFVPYSFSFREMFGEREGICGGLILHGQSDMANAYYAIHT